MSTKPTTYSKTIKYDALPTTYRLPTTYTKFNGIQPLSLDQQRYVAEYKRKLESQQNEEWAKLEAKAKRTANMNNAKQLNSLADVAGTIIGGARFDNESVVAKYLYDKLGSNLLTNTLAGTANLFSVGRQFIADPISKGEWGTAALNFLQGGIETLDILANPIKGAIIETAKGNNPLKGVVQGVGFGDKGRTTYEYDTGNRGVDFILELLSDPGVWGSFGTTAIFKSGMKKAGTEIISEAGEGVIKEVISESGEHATRQWLSRTTAEITKFISQGEEVASDAVVKYLINNAPVQRGFWHPFTEGLSKEAIQNITPDAVTEIADVVLTAAKNQAKNLSENMAYTVLKTIDSIDNTAAKTVFSPVWVPFKGVVKARKAYNSRVLRAAEPYLVNKSTLSIMDLDAVMAKAGEVGHSLTDLVEEQGLKGFSNTSIQKAFYSSAKADITKLQRLAKGLDHKAPNFSMYDYSIKQYLIETHGFSEALSTKEMLVELARAYKKAGKASDMFIGLHKNITNIIDTYDAIVNAKPYFDLLNQGAVNEQALKALEANFKEVSAEEIEAYAKQQKISIEEAAIKLKENIMFFDSDKLFDIADVAQKAYDSVFKKIVNNILQTIKTVDPELFELAKYSVSHRNLINKLVICARTYLTQSSGSEYAAEYLKHFLPPGKTLEDLVPKGVLNEDAAVSRYIEETLLEPLLKAFGVENYTTFKQSLQAVIEDTPAYDFNKDFTIHNLPKDEAVAYFKQQNAIVLNTLIKQAKKTSKKITKSIFTSAYAEEELKDLATAINLYYKECIKFLSEDSSAFQKYVKESLAESKQLSDTVSNIYSLGHSLTKNSYSNVETQVVELIKGLDERYVAKLSTDEFKLEIESKCIELKAILKTYDHNALDAVFSYTEDADLPLIDCIQNTIRDLEALLTPNKEVNARTFIDIINYLDQSVKASQKALQKSIEQGLDAGPGTLFTDVKFDLPATGLSMIPDEKQAFVLEFLEDYREVLYKGSFGTSDEAEALFKKRFPNDPYNATYYYNKARQYNEFIINDVQGQGLLEHTPFTAHAPTTRAVNKAYEDVYNKLETIVNNSRALVEFKPYEFSTTGNTIWYALKQEQTENSLAYLKDDVIFEFLNAVANNDANKIPQMLLDYTDEAYVAAKLAEETTEDGKEKITALATACKLIKTNVDSVLSYGQLLNTVETSVILTEEVRTALTTTLNSIPVATMSVEDVALDPEFLFDKIFKGIEDYVNAIRKTSPYSLDYFRDQMAASKHFEKLTGYSSAVWQRMAHHSDADVLVTEEYVKKNLSDVLKVQDNDIIIDIETTSVDRFRGEVLEISLKTKDGIVTFKRHLDPNVDVNARPSNSLLEVYSNGNLNKLDVKDAFYKYHNEGYTGPQLANNVHYFSGVNAEKEMLQAVTDYIYSSGVVFKNSEGIIDKLHPESTRLIGHNISDFDIEFLRRRAVERGVNGFTETFDRLTHVDTYKLIQEKHGYLKLNTQEKTAIESVLQDYINLRTLADNDGALKHFGEDFINAIPKGISQGLTTIIRNMPENTALEKEAKRTLQYMQTHMSSIRKTNIKDINLVVNKYIFSTDQLLSPEFKESLVKILKQDRRYANWTDAELKAYVEYLNPTKALYSGWGTYNFVGFKKIFDEKAFRNWFDGPTTIPEQMGRQAYTTVKILNRNLDRIKNPNAILPFEKALDDFLNEVDKQGLLKLTKTDLVQHNIYTSPGVKEIVESEEVLHSDLKNTAFQYLIKNTDAIAEKYVLAEYIHTILQHKTYNGSKTVLSFIPTNVVADMESVLANKKLFTHTVIRDSGETFAEHSRHLTDEEVWTTAAPFKALAEDFKHNINKFELCDELDKSELFSPEKQAFAQAAYPTFKLLDDYSEWAKDANTVQLYEMQSKLFYTTDTLNIQTLYNVLQYEKPDDLISLLAWTNGVTTFAYADAPQIFEKLLHDANKLNAAGIVTVFENNRAYLALDTTKFKYDCAVKYVDDSAVKEIYFNGKLISKPAFKELNVDKAIEACRKEFASDLGNGIYGVAGALNDARLTDFGANIKAARQGLINSSRGAYMGVQADVIDKASLRHIYSMMPEPIQKAMGDMDARLDNPAWFSETTFNLSNLGSVAAKRQIQTASALHMLSTYKNVTERVLTNQETRFKYLDMVLNSEMRLDVGAWADIANDGQILKYFKDHPEITVGIVQKPAKGSITPQLKRVAINTVEDLHNARRLHAVILSGETYSRAATVLNNSAYDTGFLKLMSNVMRVYKIGQLLTLGFLGRNFIDSTFKAYTATGDAVGTLEHMNIARKAYKEYNQALRYMLATSDLNLGTVERLAHTFGVTPQDVLNDIGLEVGKFRQRAIKDVINADVLFTKYKTTLEDIIKMDSNAVLRPENVEFYFKYMSDGATMDIDTFYEVHRFITQGASAGMSPALQKAFMKTSDQAVREYVNRGEYGKAVQEFADARHIEGVSDTVVYALGKLSSVNSHVEQVIRLAQHMQQMRAGMNFAESNWKIAKTHFDYADKTDITKSIELIFPYYNFKMNNFEFWANLMETQPWALRMVSEVMEQAYSFDSYDTYAEHLELSNNESLQYQITAGNISLFDTGAVLKINPSFTDALNLVTNPLGSVESSLFAPLNAGFKAAMLELYNQDLTNEFVNNTFGLSDYAYENQLPWQQQAINNLPLVGPTIQRFTQQMPKYAERTDSPLVRVMPSVFGATSRWSEEGMSKIKSPEEWDAIKAGWLKNIVNNQIRYNQRRKQTAYRSRGSAKKIYFKSTAYGKAYNTNSRGNRYYSYYNPSYSKYVDYYNKPYSGRYNEHSFANKSRVSRPKRVYPENIYWKYYTKSGKKRWSILSAKATKKNLQMKIKLMYDYYK